MDYKTHQKEAAALHETIRSLIGTAPSPNLPGMVESAALATDGVNRFEYSRYIYKGSVTEQIEIMFDDGSEILVHSVNGNCTVDIIGNNYIYQED